MGIFHGSYYLNTQTHDDPEYQHPGLGLACIIAMALLMVTVVAWV